MPVTSPRLSANLACLFAIIAVGIAVRLFLGYELEPVPFIDTRGFEAVARSILSMDWSAHDGRRALGYPLFLIACGLNYKIVWLAQVAAGVATSLIGFKIVLELTDSRAAALTTGLVISLGLNQLMFEIAILTETLTTALLLLMALQVVRMGIFGKLSYSSDVCLGLLAGCVSIVQPRYATVTLLCALAYCLCAPLTSQLFLRIKHLSAFLAAALPAILVGSFINLMTVGYFGLSTAGTSNVVTHTIWFIEKAGGEFDDMKDVLVAHRERLRAEHGEDAVPFAISHAHADLLRVNHDSISKMQGRLTRMSFQLICDHPDLYFPSVAKAWWNFWQPVRVAYEGFFTPKVRDPWFRETLPILWRVQDNFWPPIYVLFAVVSTAAATGLGFARHDRIRKYCLFVALFVGLTSIAQAFVAAADNPRYALPCQALIVTADMCCLWHWFRRQSGSSSTSIS